MNKSEELAINELIQKKNDQDKKLRLRSIIIITVLVLGGLLWLAWTNSQVNEMNAKLVELSDTIQVKELQIVLLKNELEEVNKELHEADNFGLYSVDISYVSKLIIYDQNVPRKLSDAFRQIMRHRGVLFSPNGAAPDVGFNSPAFITYILKEANVSPSVEKSASELSANYPMATGAYLTGDLLIYKYGYCMIYFDIQHSDTGPFVYGMTPSGILALKPNFGEVVAHLRPRYN